MAEPYVILLTLFAVGVAIYIASLLLPLERYGLEVTPIYMLYRTEKFNDLLNRVARKYQKFWRNFANIGVAVAGIEMSLAIYFLAINLYRFLYAPRDASPLVPVLPGVTISFRWLPYILIAISLAGLIHEMAHGILAFLEKIPVKSGGIRILAFIFFGAFVELDEEYFDRSPLLSKLRVIAGGSMANMATGLLTLLLLIVLFAPFSGVLVMTTPENNPAYIAGMRSWDVIYSINGQRISNIIDFTQFMVAIEPEIQLSVETSNGLLNISTKAAAGNESRGIMGVQDLVNYAPMRVGEMNSQLSYHLYMTINWIAIVMVNLAIINMLPLFTLDGEAYIHFILKEKMKKGVHALRIIINVLSLFLLLSNFVLTFIRYGLTPL